jgi:hypothetical protein
MAYGHGGDDEQMRMLDLASLALDERPALRELRRKRGLTLLCHIQSIISANQQLSPTGRILPTH